MTNFQPLALNLGYDSERHIKGNYILRGVMDRNARLTVSGDVKLGAYSDVRDNVSVTAEPAGDGQSSGGGAIVLSDQFKIPHGLKLFAEHLTINEASLPEKHLIAAPVHCTASHINARSLFLSPDNQIVHFRTPENAPAEGTSLRLGTAHGHGASIDGFEEVDAVALTSFSRSPNKPCGINCLRFKADKVEDSMIRSQHADVGTALGNVEFMPRNGAYDYDAKTPGLLTGEGHVEPIDTRHELEFQEQTVEDFRAYVRFGLQRALNLMTSHPRDFARYSENVAKVRAALKQLEEINPWDITKAELDRLISSMDAVPAINVLQMLYRHGNDEHISSYRAHVTIEAAGSDKKPAAVKVYYGNVKVKERVADHSQIEVESGRVMLGDKGHPAALGKNVTIRANEIHLFAMPDAETRKTLRLQGQVYCNGKRCEELDQLRSPDRRLG